jgi:hypothetical protein
MICVDVVCESENLPRIRLLQAHMRQLQIELNICEETPSVHTERIIYVPRRLKSKFSSTPSSPNYQRIALYLDERTEPIEGEMRVNLATWPGRSSDKDVLMLASYLRRPFGKAGDKSDKGDKANTENTTRRNIMALAGLGLFVAAFIFLANLETDQDQTANPDRQPIADTFKRVKTSINQTTSSRIENANQPTPTQVLPHSATQSGSKSPSQQAPESFSASDPKTHQPKPIARDRAAFVRQTISPCAGTNDILRGNLVWQVPSDLNPCA